MRARKLIAGLFAGLLLLSGAACNDDEGEGVGEGNGGIIEEEEGVGEE